MQTTQGNLALQPRRPQIRSAVAGRIRQAHSPVRPAFMGNTLKPRRIAVSMAPAAGQMQTARALAVHRRLMLNRFLLMAKLVAVVLTISAIFGFVLYRQARIVTMTYENASQQRTLDESRRLVGQLKEELVAQTDLDQIRQFAIHQLGLQDPAAKQIVRVVLPPSDRIVFSGATAAPQDEEAYLKALFSRVEGYFKTLSRTGDNR